MRAQVSLPMAPLSSRSPSCLSGTCRRPGAWSWAPVRLRVLCPAPLGLRVPSARGLRRLGRDPGHSRVVPALRPRQVLLPLGPAEEGGFHPEFAESLAREFGVGALRRKWLGEELRPFETRSLEITNATFDKCRGWETHPAAFLLHSSAFFF